MTTLQKKPIAAGHLAGEPRQGGSWPLRYYVIKAVFDRNFRAYFSNPAGYVFLAIFALGSVLAAFWRPEFFANNQASATAPGSCPSSSANSS